MNRIREIHNKVMSDSENMRWNIEDSEKFAELIINETYALRQQMTLNGVKKYFGIICKEPKQEIAIGSGCDVNNLGEKMMNELQSRIEKQLELLHTECQRAKMFINENGFDCTTAPYVIVKEYRAALKNQMQILLENFE